jgi:beta-glucanase (GH16 family)
MALARTDLLSQTNPANGTFGFGTGAFTSNNITTVNNSLLVVVLSGQNDNVSTQVAANLTCAGGGLTFSKRVSQNSSTSNPYNTGIAIFTAPVTTGATFALTLDCGAVNMGQYNVTAHCYTGYDTTTPTGVTGVKVLAANGADSLTLSGTPAATSEVIGGRVGGSAVNGTHGASPGTNHTEIYDQANGTEAGMQVQVQNIGTASTTFAWADVETGTGQLAEVAGAALEIKALALVRTNLGTNQASGPGTIVAATNAFTNGGLAVAIVGVQKEAGSGTDPTAGTNIAVTNSGTAYTWTKRVARGGTADYDMGIAIFTAPITAGQTASVTATFTGFTPFYKNIAVYQYTGQDASPIGVSGSKALANNGADSVTLSGTPVALSEVIGGLCHACGGNYAISASPGANHTELYDVVINDLCGMQVQVQNVASPSATFAWADTEATGAGVGDLTYGVALEILPAGAGGVTNATVTPAVIAVAATLPAITLTTTGGATRAPAEIDVTATMPAVAVASYVFFDEFADGSVDTSKWTIYNRCGDLVNGEVNGVIPANIRESAGTLKIDSKFETVVIGDSETAPASYPYTSGQVSQKGLFQYGTIEVRAKICGGTGPWPCIWMLGYLWQPTYPLTANTPGHSWPNGGWWEVDIAEFMTGHRSQQNCALHFITANRTGSGEKAIPFDATTRFMVYRLEWTPTSMVWKIDPEDGGGFDTLLTMSGTAGTDIPNTPAFLILHNAVGGVGGGTPSSGTFPVTTEIDYARITANAFTITTVDATVNPATINAVATLPATTETAGATRAPAEIDVAVTLLALMNAGPVGQAATVTPDLIQSSAFPITPGISLPGTTITYVGDASGAMSTASPSFTMSAAVATGDVMILFPSSTLATARLSVTPPTGWVHCFTTSDGHASNTASVVDTTSDSHQIGALYHIVTAGENGTTAFGPLTNLYQAAPTGRTNVICLRGVDTSAPLDAVASAFSNTNTATPHVLAGVTAGNVHRSNGWVCSSTSNPGVSSYTNPAGWVARKNETTTQGRYTGTRTALTTAGTAVTATNITPSAGDEYASVTVIAQPVVGRTDFTVVPLPIAVNATPLAVTLPQPYTATPTEIDVAATQPLVTVSTASNATLTPVEIDVVATLPAATAIAQANATVTPATLTAAATAPAPTLSLGATRSTSIALTGLVIINTPTLSTAWRVNPIEIDSVATVPAVTVIAPSNATMTPAPIATVATSPAVTLQLSVVRAPAPIAAAAILNPTTFVFSYTSAPATLGTTSTLPAVTVGTASNATLTPAPVAAVSALPTLTLATGAQRSPIEIDSIATLLATTRTTGWTVSVAVLSAVSTPLNPALTIGGSTTVTPSQIVVSATILAVTVSAGSTHTVAVLATTATLPAATTRTGWTISAAVLSAVGTLPNATLNVSSGTTMTPAVLATAATSPAVTLSIGNTRILVAIAATATLPVPSELLGWTISAAVLSTTATLPATTAQFGVTKTVAVLAVAATLPNAALVIGGSAQVNPAVLDITATLNTPTARTGWTVTMVSIAATATSPAITIIAGSSDTRTPAVLTSASTLPAAVIQSGSTRTPAVLMVTATLLAVTVRFGWTAGLLPIVAVADLLAVTLIAEGNVTKTTTAITATATLPLPVKALGAERACATVTALATLPSPTRRTGWTVAPAVLLVYVLMGEIILLRQGRTIKIVGGVLQGSALLGGTLQGSALDGGVISSPLTGGITVVYD